MARGLLYVRVMKEYRRFDWVVLLVLLAQPAARATESQSLDRVRDLAIAAVQAQLPTTTAGASKVHVSADSLDPRLRLAACAHNPQAFLPPRTAGGARLTVGVRCLQPAWTVYVSARVESEMPVLVLRSPASRNSTLVAADVSVESRRVAGLAAGFLTDPAQLAGKHLNRTGTPAMILTVDMLTADLLIRRGQRVTLRGNAGGLEVRATGEALMDAAADGRIRVLNLSSRKTVEGRVESADTVRVSL
jgi:flagella basal body P-ring formation protein FlgA